MNKYTSHFPRLKRSDSEIRTHPPNHMAPSLSSTWKFAFQGDKVEAESALTILQSFSFSVVRKGLPHIEMRLPEICSLGLSSAAMSFHITAYE